MIPSTSHFLDPKSSNIQHANTFVIASLNGDGFDDYLYVNDQGKVAMWTHLKTNPPSWSAPVLVADKQDPVDPRDVRFADLNGDGRVDYIVIDRVNGAGWVWYNRAMNPDGSVLWGEKTLFATGRSPGHAIRLFDVRSHKSFLYLVNILIISKQMTGDGRADYLSINPGSGKVDLSENLC